MAIVSLMFAKVDPVQIHAPCISCPTVGPNYCCVINEYTADGTSQRGGRERDVAKCRELRG
jgi:hypothetical protein